MSAANPALPLAPAPRWKSLNRWQAFAIHFAISLAIFIALVLMMVFFWFPGELFLLDGGWQGLKLVALIDLVLGPALTLILWQPKKKSLVFDMCVVATFQIAALVYGFITTYDQRTVALVFTEETFVSVSNADLTEADNVLIEKESQPKPLTDFSSDHPALIMAPVPNKHTFGQYLEDIFNGYPQPSERSDQYMKLTDARDDMQKGMLDEESLTRMGWNQTHEKAALKKGLDVEQLELYRFKTRYSEGVAMFDPNTLRIVDYVPLDVKKSATAATTAESTVE